MMTYFTFISSNSFTWSVVPKVPVYLVFLCFGLLHGTVPSTLSSNTNIIFIPVPPKTSTGMLKAKTMPEKSCTHLCVLFCKGGKWLIELNSPEFLRTGFNCTWTGKRTNVYQMGISWEREAPAATCAPSSLKVFKTQTVEALGNHVWSHSWPCLQKGWPRDPLRALPTWFILRSYWLHLLNLYLPAERGRKEKKKEKISQSYFS